MLKKIIGRMLPKRHRQKNLQHQNHAIQLTLPHTAAEGVIRKLVKSGFEAYLVGGAVRDLLLGITPKDFDVATNATPEQVTALFRRSRIIGRRFPIVHVLSGTETVEVSTFRSGVARQNAHGRIMKDNAYGTLEQDAVRRDFTCNALYYDIIHHQIIDFHGGIADIQAKRLVMIGQPAARYQEDPVRILRAIRLAGKLGFVLDEAVAEPIPQYVHLLRNEPISRLFDELMKILFSGHAQGCLKVMADYPFDGDVHPLLTALQAPHSAMVLKSLQQTDSRLQAGKSVSMGFILAALFWQPVRDSWQEKQSLGISHHVALSQAIHDLRETLEQGWGVPQRYAQTMREIWALQAHFESRRGGKPFRFLAQPRFRAAYDFLLLRAEFGEVSSDLADWWTAFQHGNEATRHEMVQQQNQIPNPNPVKKKRKRKPRKRPTQTAE